MLNHTKKIKEIYEVIQKMLFYMIPEKWDKLFLYSSVIELNKNKSSGELYFYYIPKGILRKKTVNVYEIPNKFNIDENEYLNLVKMLYEKIKELHEEFKKTDSGNIWSNITITIQNFRFKIEFNYDDLTNDNYNSYERHIIWRYKNLGINPEQMNKKDKEIINRYLSDIRPNIRQEVYEVGIYIKDIENMVAFNNTEEYEKNQEDNNLEEQKKIKKEIAKTKRKNQILLSEDEID